MAKRTTKQADEDRELPKPELLISRDEAKQKILERMTRGNELLQVPIRTEQDLDKLYEDKKIWHEYNFELLESMFTNKRYADEYKREFRMGSFSMGGRNLRQELIDLHDSIQTKLGKLKSLLERLPLIKESITPSGTINSSEPLKHSRPSRRVFLVHGHDEEMKQSLARFLEKLQLEPVILHEQPNSGLTVIEKIETHAKDVGFVVVALTPDDIGATKTKPDQLMPRARQNVLFEWGLFIGRYGRDRVCALYREGVELPSDISGILYTSYDDKGAWRLELAREIKASGIDVDLNLAM